MPFDDALSHDSSLKQGEYLESWESTRFSHRQDPLCGDHAQMLYGQNADLPRNHELGAHLLEVEDTEQSQSMNNSENEDSHLLENQGSSSTGAGGPPTWLSTALSRQQNQSLHDGDNPGHGEAEKWCPGCSARGAQSCVCSPSMHAGDTNATSFPNHTTYTHWLQGTRMQGTRMQAGDSQHQPGEFGGEEEFGSHRMDTGMATELNLSAAHGRDAQPFLESLSHPPVAAPRYAGEYSRADWDPPRQGPEWEELRRRYLITSHPLYPEMLANHAACLRVGTPVDQLPCIEAQLAQAPTVTEKYSVLRDQIANISREEKEDLDRFMSEYSYLLGQFKELLQLHVQRDVTEAMMSCWELEQALLSLTEVDNDCGATMSDEDVEDYDSDYGSYDQSMDFNDSGGYGPLVPTETERSLMERVRQELKHELKQGYKSKIEDVREEILRKRRAGKLPDGTTTVLKAWWQAHSKWPYPTEDEKELLIQETGLELKQVNNWFINQRKRNWHSNPLVSAQSESKNKARKSW
ncbi:hypothetical protein M758_3G077800 [Ceratodon purpureus]|uniref:Uncharacterized protein n=1 Tax=Ceratodon purpureus TaxID=3225 RepID=A0A8T0IJP5_CERPU|nr:hypothetical protein KC19_3G076700 [Ceratodon purpureus]KAG0582675.1 hypothetical protein KC19_3G076700 [Ceratodon purpureus]KAG0622181.1 hypothetical protein M758_3G077800 [Ceratodon purpureus]